MQSLDSHILTDSQSGLAPKVEVSKRTVPTAEDNKREEIPTISALIRNELACGNPFNIV